MDPIAFSIGSLDIRWYGLIISIAFAIGIVLAVRETQRQGLDTDYTYGILLWIIPAAIIGARLYYVIFSWQIYADNPISALYIWEGGLAIHGGVIAGILVAMKRISLFRLFTPLLLTPGTTAVPAACPLSLPFPT